MARIPDAIEDSSAVLFRNILLGVGVFLGLIAYNAFSNGNAGGGLLMALLSGSALYVGANINTTRHLRGAAGVYR